MRLVVPVVLLLLGFASVLGYGKGPRKGSFLPPAYSPVGFMKPPFVPFPGPFITKLKPIHVKTTVTFPNGFTRVIFPNRGGNFIPYGGAPLPEPIPVFPIATSVVRPNMVNTGFPVQKVIKHSNPKPAPVKPIIGKTETAKPIEEVGKPVFGGTFVVNIDRTKDFRPPPIRSVHFESFEVPVNPGPLPAIRSPPPPELPPPQQVWRIGNSVDHRPRNFFRQNFNNIERRFNLVPRINIDVQQPVREFRPVQPVSPPIQENLPRPPRLDPPRITVENVVPPAPVEKIQPLPVIPIQTSHPVDPPLLPPEPVLPPAPQPDLPLVPIAEIKQGPVDQQGPTRGDVPNIGLVSPVPGDQGNVIMDFKEANTGKSNVDVISNEFSDAGGVRATKIDINQANGAKIISDPSPAINVGPGPAQLIDASVGSDFVDNTRMIAADNGVFSNDLTMAASAISGHGQFIGADNSFDHVDSININIDPSLGLDFGPPIDPVVGHSDVSSQFNSKNAFGQSFDGKGIDNSLTFGNKMSDFEATSNFVEPVPIRLAEASFDNAAMSSKTSKSSGFDHSHIIKRTTTIKRTSTKSI
ncbi:uncharacterized protein LOC133172139 [Saccostrea echinata]|uniref:uncharacterized protein LOC133172139 n=1 Tax=Saccostrea echinata TaxID=191078 RepID=UPI002A831FD8|nr:uncharacterized protein LOC133172139 [Saccostrea echinata]